MQTGSIRFSKDFSAELNLDKLCDLSELKPEYPSFWEDCDTIIAI